MHLQKMLVGVVFEIKSSTCKRMVSGDVWAGIALCLLLNNLSTACVRVLCVLRVFVCDL